MNNISTGEVLTIIAAVAAAIVSIVNAVGSFWGRRRLQRTADKADVKLDQIHTLTNSSMEVLRGKLAAALERIERLEELLLAAQKGQQ